VVRCGVFQLQKLLPDDSHPDFEVPFIFSPELKWNIFNRNEWFFEAREQLEHNLIYEVFFEVFEGPDALYIHSPFVWVLFVFDFLPEIAVLDLDLGHPFIGLELFDISLLLLLEEVPIRLLDIIKKLQVNFWLELFGVDRSTAHRTFWRLVHNSPDAVEAKNVLARELHWSNHHVHANWAIAVNLGIS